MVVRYDLNEDDMGVERVLEVLSCSSSSLDVNSPDEVLDISPSAASTNYVPTIHSGSFADIGPVRSMEDEHITIDDLSVHLGFLFKCPKPSAFYGIFDGHGGPEASAFLRTNATRLFFEDSNFPQSSKVDEMFVEKVQNAMRKAFLLADLALAEDQTISNSVGTAALTVLILERFLMVANAGDCRAVLCRKGEAIEMSQDHRPVCPTEKRRVEEMGGYIDNGYLNGILSLTRALGDWDMKLPVGSVSPLISEPELRHIVLTEEDEFLIIGCDGIWDVLSSQEAVKLVRCGLRRHNDPERCARDLAMAALGLRTFDNLTAIIVCLSNKDGVGVGVDYENKHKLWRPRFRNSESCSRWQ